MLAENAERDQHRHQHADGRCFVNELRRQEEEIGENAGHRDIVFHDVAQQIEERKHVRHQHETHQQQREIEKEAVEHIGIGHLWNQEQAPAPSAGADGRCRHAAGFRAGASIAD